MLRVPTGVAFMKTEKLKNPPIKSGENFFSQKRLVSVYSFK